LRLIDTAGLSPTPQPLEKMGQEKTLERIAEADLFLLVLDATLATPSFDSDLLRRMTAENAVAVLNKGDLLHGMDSSAKPPAGLPAVRLSALTGDGLDALHAEIARLADRFQVRVGNDLIAINARHAHALERAMSGLSDALGKLAAGSQTELLASDLRAALDALGEISGKVDNERMLDQLFATFCIGK